MKKDGSRKGQSGRPHSERSGETVLESGERAALYRALRELSCSRCGGVIGVGDLFTRETEPASGLPLVRRCRRCVPFSTGRGLLNALLSPEEVGEATPPSAPEVTLEKALSRLGPALAASRSRRGPGKNDV